MYAKKILLKSDNFFGKNTGLTFDTKLSHNVTTLDNNDIDSSMSHVLLFPKIYNLAVCHTIKVNRQKSIPCYPTIRSIRYNYYFALQRAVQLKSRNKRSIYINLFTSTW